MNVALLRLFDSLDMCLAMKTKEKKQTHENKPLTDDSKNLRQNNDF